MILTHMGQGHVDIIMSDQREDYNQQWLATPPLIRMGQYHHGIVAKIKISKSDQNVIYRCSIYPIYFLLSYMVN